MKCPKCTMEIPDDATVCSYCGKSFLSETEDTSNKQEIRAADDRFLPGLVGALSGAVLGSGLFILMSQINLVPFVAGMIIAVLTLKGYSLLSGKLTMRGVIACALILLFIPYLADRLDWAIVVVKAFPDIPLFNAFLGIPSLISEKVIAVNTYVGNLLKLYGLTALGAFIIISPFSRRYRAEKNL